MKSSAPATPDALVHVGFGLGLVGMNTALDAIGWAPPRYTTTAFEFAATSEWWRHELAGWIGLDQWDERNTLAQEFLDQFAARYGRRPEYFFPLVCFDIGRVLMLALSQARPLTGTGVKESLERIKMLPAVVWRAGNAYPVRALHPSGLDGQRVPRGATSAAERERHRDARNHRGPRPSVRISRVTITPLYGTDPRGRK